MIPEEIKDSPFAPFIMNFTLAILLNLRGKQVYIPKREVIHADLVPKVSSHVMHASMMPRENRPLPSPLW